MKIKQLINSCKAEYCVADNAKIGITRHNVSIMVHVARTIYAHMDVATDEWL